MPGNVSITSLCQRALYAIGGKAQIQSINEQSPQGIACNTLFAPTFQQLARAARWNCLERQAPLSLIYAAANTPENPNATPPFPPEPWIYEYLLPTDCLMAHFILPTFPQQTTSGSAIPPTTNSYAAPIWLRGMGQIPFQVMTDMDSNNNPRNIICTNQEQAILNYTADIENPALWDTQFQAAFVATLAAFLVPALALNMQLMQVQIAIAERTIAEARARDGNENPQSQDHTPDFIRARSGGATGFYSGTWGNNWGYCNIAWPGYGV